MFWLKAPTFQQLPLVDPEYGCMGGEPHLNPENDPDITWRAHCPKVKVTVGLVQPTIFSDAMKTRQKQNQGTKRRTSAEDYDKARRSRKPWDHSDTYISVVRRPPIGVLGCPFCRQPLLYVFLGDAAKTFAS